MGLSLFITTWICETVLLGRKCVQFRYFHRYLST